MTPQSPTDSVNLLSSSNQSTRRNPWVPETTHATENADGRLNGHATSSNPQTHRVSHPDPKSPAAISLRAFILGCAFGISLLLTLYLLVAASLLWRAPFFLLVLSLFHFLEFYTTARYNPSEASISAFLLSQNGRAYNAAHTLALVECIAGNYSTFSFIQQISDAPYLICMVLGLSFVVIGQVTRTAAMAQAGSNFNHLVQSRRKEGHVLVTDGIYGCLRHPSYFGFWWWGIGTQIVLGNAICLVGYMIVLWRFFKRRIECKFIPVVLYSAPSKVV